MLGSAQQQNMHIGPKPAAFTVQPQAICFYKKVIFMLATELI